MQKKTYTDMHITRYHTKQLIITKRRSGGKSVVTHTYTVMRDMNDGEKSIVVDFDEMTIVVSAFTRMHMVCVNCILSVYYLRC